MCSQDTLAADVGRQYYKFCLIQGTVDFVFGVAAAVFEDCTLAIRVPPTGYQSTIAAQGRASAADPSAFVFLRGRIVGASNAAAYGYLGRPWFPFSRVLYINVFMSQVLSSA